MMVSEEDKQAVGWADMRQFREWLRTAPLVLRLAAVLYPPSVYRVIDVDGTPVRVFPNMYYQDDAGELLVNVTATVELNPEHPYMHSIRITGVPIAKLAPIKWPPDARVH